MKLRLATDIPVWSLSKQTGISRRMISRMESDENYNPGVLTILRVSEFFKVRIDDLLIKD